MYISEGNNSTNWDGKTWVKLNRFDTILLYIADAIATHVQIKYDKKRKYNYMGYDRKELKIFKRGCIFYKNIPKP